MHRKLSNYKRVGVLQCSTFCNSAVALSLATKCCSPLLLFPIIEASQLANDSTLLDQGEQDVAKKPTQTILFHLALAGEGRAATAATEKQTGAAQLIVSLASAWSMPWPRATGGYGSQWR